MAAALVPVGPECSKTAVQQAEYKLVEIGPEKNRVMIAHVELAVPVVWLEARKSKLEFAAEKTTAANHQTCCLLEAEGYHLHQLHVSLVSQVDIV